MREQEMKYLSDLDEQEFAGEPSANEKLPTVLIVDDDITAITVIRGCLEEAGHPVLVAQDGPEATELLRANHEEIGLVVLDWILPSMSGAEWLEYILQIKPGVKVIFCTGPYTSDALYKVVGLNVKDFLRKPFDHPELLDALRQALSDDSSPLAGYQVNR